MHVFFNKQVQKKKMSKIRKKKSIAIATQTHLNGSISMSVKTRLPWRMEFAAIQTKPTSVGFKFF